jgi:hypothetical protein
VSQSGKSFRGRRPFVRASHAADGQDGYAAVDALVALMILASTLVAALSATHGSRLVADAALELRQANELSAYLLETSPRTPGETSGEAEGFAWTRQVSEPVATFGAGAICERRVALTGLRDHRLYTTRTNAVCPAKLET